MDCRSEMKFLVNDAGGGREMWDVEGEAGD